jgi:hypothetical protein
VQKDHRPAPRVKGWLPVPRDIFDKRRGGVNKVTRKYLRDVTPVSRETSPSTAQKHDPEAERNEWKAKMADKRRQNLQEGLKELQQRRKQADALAIQRTSQKQAERENLLSAAEREDERLTSSTTTRTMQSGHTINGRLPDPNREQRLAEMRARVAAKEAQRTSDRQDALHTLYMHARDFIVSEQQLDAAIDTAFGTTQQPVTFGNRGSSVWAQALPQSIQDKLNSANKARGTFADKDWIADMTNKRIGKIAEKLTGGKMDNV